MERDRRLIREMIEAWVVWRDSGQFDRLATLYHPDGVMNTTWHRSPAPDFIRASSEAWKNGMDVQHMLGGSVIEISGDRAIAQTKMSISQRGTINGTLVDVFCYGRFFDLFEKREGDWGLLERQPLYDRDRLDCVEPGQTVDLDLELLRSFPVGYRHLAYLQTTMGFEVDRDLPGRGDGTVREAGERWLEGVA